MRAAFVLAWVGDRLLAVTRPEGGWALPGGVVEPGETLDQAAARELYEETGVVAGELRPLVSERRRAVFLGTRLSGRIRSSEEGVAALVRPDSVIGGPYGAFALAAIRAGRI